MINYMTATAATLQTSSSTITVTGESVDFSKIDDNYVVLLDNGLYVMPVLSGSSFDGSGNSTLTLVEPWQGAPLTNKKLLVLPVFAKVYESVTAMTALNDVTRGILLKLKDLLTATSPTLDVQVGTSATISAVPYGYLANQVQSTIDSLNALNYLTTDDIGTASGNVMEVGAFGLGRSKGFLIPNGDGNALTVTGIYSTGGVWVGSPFPGAKGNNQGTLHHSQSFALLDTHATQIFIPMAESSNLFFRKKESNVWSSWSEVYHRGNILGTVSQSGGVPTGAILERGSNANGEYTKFADGTMICIQLFEDISVSESTTSGYESGEIAWSFPRAFSGVFPQVNANANSTTIRVGTNMNNTLALIRLYSESSVSTNRIVVATAIGKWY
jgi:hypothetical protein